MKASAALGASARGGGGKRRRVLLRKTAKLQGTSDPVAADVPGDGGRFPHSPTEEMRRLDGRSNPATAADLVRGSVALRLEVNMADRDWVDGLSEGERTEAQ